MKEYSVKPHRVKKPQPDDDMLQKLAHVQQESKRNWQLPKSKSEQRLREELHVGTQQAKSVN